MGIFQKLYFLLFNAITDALAELEQGNAFSAANLLRHAQTKAEELYMDSDEPIN